jgi:hypothetical protein
VCTNIAAPSAKEEASAAIGEDDIPRIFLSRGGLSGSSGAGSGDRGGGGNAELLADRLNKLVQLKNGKGFDVFNKFLGFLRSHRNVPPVI